MEGEVQADPNPLGNVDLADDVILNKQVALKVVTLHKIYDPYVSKNLKREPAIMAKMTKGLFSLPSSQDRNSF